MNFEAVTPAMWACGLNVNKEVLNAYHGAVKQDDPADKQNAENAQKHSDYAGFRRFLIPQPT